MQTTIGAFDPFSKTVDATFTKGAVVHTRQVHACLDEHFDYDPDATALRIADVARGVERKIDTGAITAPPPPPEPVDEPAPL